VLTSSSFNNRVAHEPSLIEPSPSELTGSFASFTSLHVCMYGRDMTLIRLVWMFYIWSACITWVFQKFGMSCIHVRPRYNDDLTCWDVKFWSICIHVFPKGSEEMHAYIAKILRWMFFLWFNIGSARIYTYIPQRFGVLYVCSAVMLYPLIFPIMHCLGVCVYWNSSKVRMTCMHIRPRHSINYLFRYQCMPVFSKRFKNLVYENIWVTWYICNDVYNVDYFIYEPNTMVYFAG
jgi:hypothetical protein